MNERRILSTWKEIAAYLSRGIRTAQRWEINYKLPVHRPKEDVQSVFAFTDEIDAWMERARPRNLPYVRPTFIVIDTITIGSLSDLKLSLEGAKFNVLTAFTSAELLATAERYDVDGFVVDSILLDTNPSELGDQLQERFPKKTRVLIGEDNAPNYEATFPSGNSGLVVEWLIGRHGAPQLIDPALGPSPSIDD